MSILDDSAIPAVIKFKQVDWLIMKPNIRTESNRTSV